MPRTDVDLGPLFVIFDTDASGLITRGTYPGTIPTTAGKFAVGAIVTNTATALPYYNAGTTASPSWNSLADVSQAEIADSSISAAKIVASQSVTATDDGLTTGLITTPVSQKTVVNVTSAGATKAVTLPAASSALIGAEILIIVGANGYELLTPATGNNTINTVDSDGTNQLDVAATTTVRCTCISATGWVAETIAATTIAVTAPDND